MIVTGGFLPLRRSRLVLLLWQVVWLHAREPTTLEDVEVHPAVKELLGSSTLVEHVYVTNLQRSVDRRAFMEAQLDAAGVSPDRVTWVPAVDGSSLHQVAEAEGAQLFDGGASRWATDIDDEGLRMEVVAWNEESFNWIKPAQLGCTLSHMMAVYLAHQAGYERVLLLEDDVSFAPRNVLLGEESIAEAVHSLPEDWSLLQLEATILAPGQMDKMKSLYFDQGLLATPRCPCNMDSTLSQGTVAMLVHRRGMESILERLWPGGTDGTAGVPSPGGMTSDLKLYGVFDLRAAPLAAADYALYGMPGVYTMTRPAFLPPEGFDSLVGSKDTTLTEARALALRAFPVGARRLAAVPTQPLSYASSGCTSARVAVTCVENIGCVSPVEHAILEPLGGYRVAVATAYMALCHQKEQKQRSNESPRMYGVTTAEGSLVHFPLLSDDETDRRASVKEFCTGAGEFCRDVILAWLEQTIWMLDVPDLQSRWVDQDIWVLGEDSFDQGPEYFVFRFPSSFTLSPQRTFLTSLRAEVLAFCERRQQGSAHRDEGTACTEKLLNDVKAAILERAKLPGDSPSAEGEGVRKSEEKRTLLCRRPNALLPDPLAGLATVAEAQAYAATASSVALASYTSSYTQGQGTHGPCLGPE